MGAKIVSRSLSKQERDNWDKIFKKTKKARKDQQINPMIPKIIPMTIGNSDVIPLRINDIVPITNEETCKPADYPGNWDDATFLNNWHIPEKKNEK